jgi:hypothetical protein
MSQLTYLGELTVGACIPDIMPTYAALVGELQAKLAGAIALAAQLQIRPPSLSVNLDIALKMIASLKAAIQLGMPGIDFQISAVASFIDSIRAQLALLLSLAGVFATAGIHAYAYDGISSDLGNLVSAETRGGFPGGFADEHCNALILATTVGAAWTAMGMVLRTS